MNELTTRFVTFYSYKGGVGRTSALVSVAVQQALRGNNILILDFDLEAPGTCPYLKKLDPDYNEHKEGLLEYFVASIEGVTVPTLRDKAVDLSPHLRSDNGGHLWVINAGNTKDVSYTSRLEKLRWSEIFQKQFGELLLKNFRNQIIDEFFRPDYVFVDSRTGITETGGVCTRYLADTIVILTSLNEQNINGTGMIYKELAADGKETILVAANVPVGMPTGRDQLFVRRIETFEKVFQRAPDLFIYYYPVLSLSEEIPGLLLRKEAPNTPMTSHLIRTDPLVQSYRSLVQTIDKPREDQISFLPAVSRAVGTLRTYNPNQSPSTELNILKQYYSDRLLAKIVIDAFDFKQSCLENAGSPENWNREAFTRLLQAVKAVTNNSVQEIVDILQEFLYHLLRQYLEAGRVMETSLESFFTPELLNRFVLQEISRSHWEWPIDNLTRALAATPIEDSAAIACHLYNLAHCFIKKGDSKKGESLLLRFVDEFKKIKIAKFSAIVRVNFYFAAALAYKELERMEQAQEMRKNAEENLSMLKVGTYVLSPLTYTHLPVKDIRVQLDNVF